MKRYILTFFSVCGLLYAGYGQDAHYSQFYANRIYTNPAFAGTSGNISINTTIRKQFKNLPNSYISSVVSGDLPIPQKRSSIGFVLHNNTMNGGTYSYNQASFIYAYMLKLKKDKFINLSIQSSFNNRMLDYSKLSFGDQLEADLGVVRNTNERFVNNSVNYASFSTGFVYGTDKLFTGMAIHNLNEPNMSFIERHKTDKDYLQLRRYVFHIGLNIKTRKYSGHKKHHVFSPNVLVMNQGNHVQLNIGSFYNYSSFGTGIWIRQTSNNTDGIVFVAGYTLNKVKFGYSYDMGLVSELNHLKSAHELSLQFIIESKKPYKIIPAKLNCPQLW